MCSGADRTHIRLTMCHSSQTLSPRIDIGGLRIKRSERGVKVGNLEAGQHRRPFYVRQRGHKKVHRL